MITSVTLHAATTPTAPALVLRPWRVEDVPALVEYFRDPGIRGSTNVSLEAEEDAVWWVRAHEEKWAAGTRFGFAVLESPGDDTATGQVVGNVVLKDVAPGKPSAEVGYWTAAQARGRSVAPRALEALTAWALETFRPEGLEHLTLLHQEDNLASCRVAVKCGYEFDSTLPAAPPTYPLDGHLHIRHATA
ncbi:GNAT family N-acetyltransferase [Streptomyces sp. NPDC015130]|uniref:GNAT family N-acetyltransferase n=1 Tax=Streptomyces sp. NPDC015130 TaxID=3364940 RepID=UPI0037024CF3